VNKGITLRPQGNNSISQLGTVAVGAGASTDGLKFQDRAEMYSDLPTTFRKGAAETTALVLASELKTRQGSTAVRLADHRDLRVPLTQPPVKEVLASGVRKLEKSFKNGQRIVQRKWGWQATPTQLTVVTVERELIWRSDGKLTPSGDWLIEHRKTWIPTQGVATKRTGKVSQPSASNETNPASDHYVEIAEAIPDAFIKGAEAMAYLPRPVRGDIVAQVPNPTYFDGRLLGVLNKENVVEAYEISLLRMDDNVALVILALCPINGTEWEVTQAKYLLTTPRVETA
jgi:hypothetical protein